MDIRLAPSTAEADQEISDIIAQGNAQASSGCPESHTRSSEPSTIETRIQDRYDNVDDRTAYN
jgi:hypothetical protein